MADLLKMDLPSGVPATTSAININPNIPVMPKGIAVGDFVKAGISVGTNIYVTFAQSAVRDAVRKQ